MSENTFSEWYRNNQFHNGDGRMDYAEKAWNAQQKDIDELTDELNSEFPKAKSEALELVMYRLREVWEYDIPAEVEGDLVSWEWYKENDISEFNAKIYNLESEVESLDNECSELTKSNERFSKIVTEYEDRDTSGEFHEIMCQVDKKYLRETLDAVRKEYEDLVGMYEMDTEKLEKRVDRLEKKIQWYKEKFE